MYFSMIFLINNSMQKNSNSQFFSIFCIQMGEAWYSPSIHNRRWKSNGWGRVSVADHVVGEAIAAEGVLEELSLLIIV
jgi:hypothetical protein